MTAQVFRSCPSNGSQSGGATPDRAQREEDAVATADRDEVEIGYVSVSTGVFV
jgi:hypothetical protein